MRTIRVITALLSLLSATGTFAASNDCNRECLKTMANRYLDAMVKHSPVKAALAVNFRYTENAVEVATGEGLWKSTSGLGKIQRVYVDPTQGQAVFFGLIEESGQPAIVSLRLKVANHKISEAEAIVGRKGVSLFDAQNLIDHPPSDQAVAKAVRTPRKEMLAAAASYFDGAQSQNPAIVLQKPGCDRYENGVKTTHRPGTGASGLSTEQDCAGSLAQMKQISGVVNRRFIVVDEEAGIVAATAIFNRPPGAKRADGTLWPRLLFTEFFPIEEGKFTAIYAAMYYLPADAKDSGWDK